MGFAIFALLAMCVNYEVAVREGREQWSRDIEEYHTDYFKSNPGSYHTHNVVSHTERPLTSYWSHLDERGE